MGNCTVKGTTVSCSTRGTAVNCSRRTTARVRIMTDSCRIIELEGPIQVRDVIGNFPRHGIFRQGDLSSPLLRHEQLLNGRLYYLLPLDRNRGLPRAHAVKPLGCKLDLHSSSSLGMSSGFVRNLEVLPPPMKGVWRVKMAIGSDQLADILSGQVNTEALIERMSALASFTDAAPMQSKRGKVRSCDRI